MKSIKDILDVNNKNFVDENTVLSKLTDKRNGLKRYRIIKSSIDKEWLNILKGNNDNTQVNTLSKRKNTMHEGTVQINNMPLKEIQYLLNENNFEPKCIDKWNTVFDAVINWNIQWKCSK